VDYWQIVGRRYFKTLGVRLIEGWLFDERDGPNAPFTVIANQTMARHFWGSQSPLGRRVRPNQRFPWFTVVGVVADVKNAGVDRPTGTELYFSHEQLEQGTPRDAWVFVKTAGDPVRFARAARAKIAEVDSALPVAQVRAMQDVLTETEARPRFLMLLLTLFSGVALALAAVGIYGVISYSVARQTGEIGIRMALGARPADVLRTVLGRGARLGAAGVALGMAGALVLTRLIAGCCSGRVRSTPERLRLWRRCWGR
jgi:putative ABC transport system permease protein